MRVLVVYSHPVETSFNASLHRDVVATLKTAGHEVDDCDLYAEGFDPVMGREERLGYHEVPKNREPVRAYVERLQHAEALVLCFPIWCFGLPAMLKGWFDRVFMPGVAFDFSDPRRLNCTELVHHATRAVAPFHGVRPVRHRILFLSGVGITPDAFLASPLELVWASASIDRGRLEALRGRARPLPARGRAA